VIAQGRIDATTSKRRLIGLDDTWSALGGMPAERRSCDTLPGTLAYVVYTSGSTGTPKPVAISHAALANRIAWGRHAFALGPDDVILQNTSFGFDVSIWEIFTALCSGTTTRLVVSPEAAAGNPSLLVETIRRWDVTVMGLVPSVLELVLQEPNLEACSCLRHVFAGGERLDNRTREAFFRRLPTARLYNFYGPAEATVDSTYFECRSGPAERDVPIGRPIGNFRTMILDAEDQLVPPGVPGELCVGGVGLARGYLNAPRLTAERFVPDPFANGQRVYRTGDVARYRRDGQIEYLGRADNQIKLRGMRVELGEIERQLEGHPGVLRAIVSAASAAVDSRHLRITKLVDALESLSDLEAEALLATKAGAPDVVTSTSAAIEQ